MKPKLTLIRGGRYGVPVARKPEPPSTAPPPRQTMLDMVDPEYAAYVRQLTQLAKGRGDK